MPATEGIEFERLDVTEPTKSGLAGSAYIRATEEFEPAQQPIVRKIPLTKELIDELTTVDY